MTFYVLTKKRPVEVRRGKHKMELPESLRDRGLYVAHQTDEFLEASLFYVHNKKLYQDSDLSIWDEWGVRLK